MQKIIKVIDAVVIMLFVLLIAFPYVMGVFPDDSSGKALDEKRETVDFPIEYSNDFFQRLESWYNDKVPFRLNIISIQKSFSQKYSSFYRENIYPLICEWLEPEWYNCDWPYLAPQEDNSALYGRNSWLFYTGDSSIDYYRGINMLDEETKVDWRNTLVQLQSECDENGIRLVVLVAPNKEQVYSHFMPSYYVETEYKREQDFFDYMKSSDIAFIYPINELTSYTKKNTYHKQDTHWNSVGAYIGYTEIQKALGLSIVPIELLQIDMVEKNGGDLSNMCGYSTTYNDYIVSYKPDVVTEKESHHDGYIEIYDSFSNGLNNAVVIGDSFRTALQEFIVKDFNKVTVAHRALVEEEEVKNSLSALDSNDALIIVAVERYDEYNIQTMKMITDILRN